MSNPWDSWVANRNALEEKLGRLQAEEEEIVRDLPTARANVTAKLPSEAEAKAKLNGLVARRNDLIKEIAATEKALQRIETAPSPTTTSSGSTSSGGTHTEEGANGMIHRAVQVVGTVTIIILLSVLAIFAATGFGAWWGENKAAIQEAIDDLIPDFGCVGIGCPSSAAPAPTQSPSAAPIVTPSPTATLPPRATPEPSVAPTAVVTPTPAPTPSTKPGYIPPPSDALVCTSTKFDLAGRTSLAGITLGGYNNVQFYWNSADPEKATLVPPGQENREFANPALGANWAFSPACSLTEVQTQTQASVNIRQNLPNAEDPYFRADWLTSGLYN